MYFLATVTNLKFFQLNQEVPKEWCGIVLKLEFIRKSPLILFLLFKV